MIDSAIVGNISVLIAFVEGLISFFSPCVIPLLPIYLGYLSGNMEEEAFSRKKTIFFTMSFILGIFIALLFLNTSFTVISMFFKSASIWFIRIGGIFIILLGCIQLGLLKIPFFAKTFHLSFNFASRRMSPILAFIMGFTFSFSWTPCIGPALTSILILASNSGSFWVSTLYVMVYAIGFALPFLLISFFAKQVTTYFQKHHKALAVIVKIGGIILILMGAMMFAGKLSVLGSSAVGDEQDVETQEETTNEESTKAPRFALEDQFGNKIKMSSFEGKVVLMNFWATWCPNCEKEIPALQALYEKYKDSEDVAIITLVSPNVGKEQDVAGIMSYIEEHEISFPVLFDSESRAFSQYGISAFPTMFLIDKEQNVYGYIPGMIDQETMQDLIDKALSGKLANE